MNHVAPDPSLHSAPERASIEEPSAVGPRGAEVSLESDPDGLAGSRAIPLSHRVPFSALETVFGVTVARQVRGRRLLIFVLLFSLPALFALLARRYQDPYQPDEAETVLIFGLIPQALLPLTALLFASGMVQDDVEEQTLTYLLMRPIPRWLIYIVKVVATWSVTALLAALLTTVAVVIVHQGEGSASGGELAQRAAAISGLLALSLLAYVSLFGMIGLLIKRSLVLGVAYIVLFEGVLANIDFVVRHATVMYYFRTLSIRWLGLPGNDWSIDPEVAPSVFTCLLVLLAATVLFTLAGAWIFSIREFRVKTPEGN